MQTKTWLAGLFLALTAFTPAARADGTVRVKLDKVAVDFLVGDELVTRYHVRGYPRPIFWPVFAPGMVPLTRAWPMEKGAKGESTDHVHQKSAWFVHGDVIPEGVELKQKIKGVDGVDFWSEAAGHGKIVCADVKEIKTGDNNHAGIRTWNEWQTADGTKILDEVRTLHFYAVGNARLIVFDIDLAADVAPITFGDTKEGALGIRIIDVLRADKVGMGRIKNADGEVGEKEAWGKFSAWCDYSGPLDGKTVGLALLADPHNPVPTAWHVRGYGLMAANPFGRSKAAFPATKGRTDLVRLEKGQHLKLRYGMLLHEGDAEAANLPEQYLRFIALRATE